MGILEEIQMKNQFEMKRVFPVPPSEIYNSWLDSVHHTKMTGGSAFIGPNVGEKFTAWDGYISGKNIELIEDKKIVQAWRTTNFEEEEEDSRVTITLEPAEHGTMLTLLHKNIPTGQPEYEKGWDEHYFVPMAQYFGHQFESQFSK